MSSETAIREAIDRHGSDFNAWPDRRLAGEAREAILANRALRAWYDDAVTLERGLTAARVAADFETAASGALARVEQGLSRRLLPSRPQRSRRWIAIAAGLVIAAGLGSAYDLATFAVAQAGRPINVVVLDPLVFGPAEVETQ
jgi:hypothetical protein